MEPKYISICIIVYIKKHLHFFILNNIFLVNVFDFRLCSQFHRSIDEAIQENQNQ
jgi:hypothetical protein